VCCSVLQCVAVCCSVLQCVAVCCSVLQYVAVCCSVLQCVAAFSLVAVCRHYMTWLDMTWYDMTSCTSGVLVSCSILQCLTVPRVSLCDTHTHTLTFDQDITQLHHWLWKPVQRFGLGMRSSMPTVEVGVSWLIRMCAITHPYVWHDSFIRVPGLIHMYDMTHSYVCHDSFICVPWLIHMYDMTHS